MEKVNSILLATLACCFVFVMAKAQESDTAMKSERPKTGFRAEFSLQWDDMTKKFVSLAEAIPQEKYSWRPGDGVRSIAEVLAHVAAGNYVYGRWLGLQPPASVDMQNIEKTADKAVIVQLLRDSFEHIRGALLKTADADLDKPVKMMNRDGTVREAFFFIATHQPEHLGQMIAYARMVNVVPPWTAERQARQQQQQQKN